MHRKSSQITALILIFIVASSTVAIAVRQFVNLRNQVYWDAYYGNDK